MLSASVKASLLLALLWEPTASLQPSATDTNGDGVSDGSPDLRYYAAVHDVASFGPDSDPHAVHGIGTRAGGIVAVGKYNSVSPGSTGGFVFAMPNEPVDKSYLTGGKAVDLLNDGKATTWTATFGSGTGFNGANQVVELGSSLYVSGFAGRLGSPGVDTVDGMLIRYDTATGSKVWEKRLNGGSGTSALESIATTSDDGIVVGGLANGQPDCLEGFKSYGNPKCGTAVLMYFASDALAENVRPSTPPAPMSGPQTPTWSKTYPGFLSIKSVKEIPEEHGGGFVLATMLNDPEKEGTSAVIRTDTDGDLIWSKTYPDHGEVTDITIISNGGVLTFMITGHGGDGSSLSGLLSKIDGATGSKLWTKAYGGIVGGKYQFAGLSDGNPEGRVYTECWSVTASNDGSLVILGCGTGIESCPPNPPSVPPPTVAPPLSANPSSPPMSSPSPPSTGRSSTVLPAVTTSPPSLAESMPCSSDPRLTWRSLLLAIEVTSGRVAWHRLDNFESDDAGTVGVTASASEFVVLTEDDSILSVNDEAFGFGFMVTDPLGNAEEEGVALPSPTSPPSSPSNLRGGAR